MAKNGEVDYYGSVQDNTENHEIIILSCVNYVLCLCLDLYVLILSVIIMSSFGLFMRIIGTFFKMSEKKHNLSGPRSPVLYKHSPFIHNSSCV